MRYYILDDAIGIIKTLEHLIESRDLGEVIGSQTDPEKAIGEIISLDPDIVLIDFLMSKRNGISTVAAIKPKKTNIRFVMISRISDKSMVSDAYNAGIDFYINKPINAIEVENVLKKVAHNIKMEGLLYNLKEMVDGAGSGRECDAQVDPVKEIKLLLSQIGILGEKGARDIMAVCQYLMSVGGDYNRANFHAACAALDDNPKNVDQRIRRAVRKGLHNMAHLAIEDYSNPILQDYAGYVFDFSNIKNEMDYIRNHSHSGGRVNISKFMDGVLIYVELKK